MLESLYNKVEGLETLTQVFSSKYCEIFRSTYFEEHLQTAAQLWPVELNLSKFLM